MFFCFHVFLRISEGLIFLASKLYALYVNVQDFPKVIPFSSLREEKKSELVTLINDDTFDQEAKQTILNIQIGGSSESGNNLPIQGSLVETPKKNVQQTESQSEDNSHSQVPKNKENENNLPIQGSLVETPKKNVQQTESQSEDNSHSQVPKNKENENSLPLEGSSVATPEENVQQTESQSQDDSHFQGSNNQSKRPIPLWGFWLGGTVVIIIAIASVLNVLFKNKKRKNPHSFG